MNEFTKVDSVTWETSQGKTRGKVVKKKTTPTNFKDHEVKALKSNPEYIVRAKNPASARPIGPADSQGPNASSATTVAQSKAPGHALQSSAPGGQECNRLKGSLTHLVH